MAGRQTFQFWSSVQLEHLARSLEKRLDPDDEVSARFGLLAEVCPEQLSRQENPYHG
jgi:hypothetical protein